MLRTGLLRLAQVGNKQGARIVRAGGTTIFSILIPISAIIMRKFLPFMVAAMALVSCHQTTSTAAHGDSTAAAVADSSPKDGQVVDTSKTNLMGKAMDLSMDSMMTTKLTGDPDQDFAMMMNYHHDGAVRIANVELVSGTDSTLKSVARKIIDESKKDNARLDTFLLSHKPSHTSAFGRKAMDMMHQSTVNGLKVLGGNLDLDFTTLMIQHHNQAIAMARAYLKESKDETMKTIAHTILIKEPRDIEALSAWKNKHYPGTH